VAAFLLVDSTASYGSDNTMRRHSCVSVAPDLASDNTSTLVKPVL